jgi:hypothetical protein
MLLVGPPPVAASSCALGLMGSNGTDTTGTPLTVEWGSYRAAFWRVAGGQLRLMEPDLLSVSSAPSPLVAGGATITTGLERRLAIPEGFHHPDSDPVAQNTSLPWLSALRLRNG